MERKLASLQKIQEILPHPNADRLEIARVLGWRVIVGKGEFHAGDWCIYFEIDAKFPEEDPIFQSVAPLKASHFRLKTVRLRGELSQGLCLPLKIIENRGVEIPLEEGQDVTDLLKITKYEVLSPGESSGVRVGPFPAFVPKTDQMRLQSYPTLMEEIYGQEVYVTTKYDGTSFTAYYHNGKFGFCRRNAELTYSQTGKTASGRSTNPYEEIARKLDLENRLKNYQKNMAIQGEICGPKLAKNRLALKELDLFLFDIFDIDQACYVDLDDFLQIANDLKLNTVDVQETQRKMSFKTIDEYLDYAKGNYRNTSNPREGVVIRPRKNVYSPTLNSRLSFKVINNEYLEKFNL